ncbi:regulatory LuxR family protein [Kitasatospora sp. SolWspMP-SS2h]|uniref:LuxR C-terminal-related transcriptional regulator n=1 Tax=Kitasatospora sp. SolWspMP-SS2h TaxID=1305729 RepID=UPI000DB9ADCD|nr:LuxR C-terminal-related transcriptional regulator [Kitasatospora sp. SolWspMP-SS2h]RAJ47036.1 regulatory LuxR family protein [Kitasatospora sp. SolWspMP-SS2h]
MNTEHRTGDPGQEDVPRLSPAAERLYVRSLSSGGLPNPAVGGGPVGLSAACLSPDELAASEQLLRLGLLAADAAEPARLVPVDPQLAAASVRRRVRLQSARIEEHGSRLVGELTRLSHLYDQASEEGPQAAPVQDLVGLDMITSAIDEAMRDCTEEALTAQPGNGRRADALARALGKAEDLLARGAHLRTLYQHPARFSEPIRDYVTKVSSLGAEVRTLDELPKRLMIFDRRTAFVSAAQDSRRAVLVRHPALVAYLTDTFERDWRRASPYDVRYRGGSAGRGLNEVQQTILRMLVDGEPDDAIARRMSLNVRTCRAHIAKILKAYDAQSRVQMAYQLGRSEALSGDGLRGGVPSGAPSGAA